MGFRDAIVEQGRRVVEGLREGVIKPVERIPVERINLRFVVGIILKPPLNAEDDNSILQEFTIPSLLNQMGYRVIEDGISYRDDFPDAYSKTRGVIDELFREGLLRKEQFDKPDMNREDFIYIVTSRSGLEEVMRRSDSQPGPG